MVQDFQPKTPNNKTILFFCRENCEFSKMGINLMLDLGYTLKIVFNQGKGGKLPKDIELFECDYIICFRSWFILPKKLIEKPKYFAINLHPGPPAYPGSGCINFAFYNEENYFGVTTHLMEEKVDSGKIIDYETFPLLQSQTLENVLKTTHQKLYNQLTDLILNLSAFGNDYVHQKIKENESVKWSKKKRKLKEVEEHREIKFDMDKKEIAKRIRSFHHPDYPVFIILDEKRFYLKK